MPERDYGIADLILRGGESRAGTLRSLGAAKARTLTDLGNVQAQGYLDSGARTALLAGSLAKIAAGAVEAYGTQKIEQAKLDRLKANDLVKAEQDKVTAAREAQKAENDQKKFEQDQWAATTKAKIDGLKEFANISTVYEKASPEQQTAMWQELIHTHPQAATIPQPQTPEAIAAIRDRVTTEHDRTQKQIDALTLAEKANALRGPAAVTTYLQSIGTLAAGMDPAILADPAKAEQFVEAVASGMYFPETADPIAIKAAVSQAWAIAKNNPKALVTLGMSQKDLDARADKAIDNKRLDATAAEQARHNRVMEAKPTGGASAAAPGLDEGGLELAAAIYRITRQLPSRNANQTTPILNAAARQAKELGQTPAQTVQRQYAMKADSSALDQATKLATSVEGFEAKAIQQADIVEALSKKVGRTSIPLLNKALLAGKADILGDPDTRLLFNAIGTFTSEYAKIIEGSTGSVAGSSDSARKKAEEMVRAIDNPATVTKLIAQMKREMSLTRQGWDATIGHITERMGGSPAAAAPGGGILPPPSVFAGKPPGTYPVTSPDGKQIKVIWDGSTVKGGG